MSDIPLGSVPLSTIDNTDNIIIAEGTSTRKVSYSSIKNDIIGTETLTTTAQTVKGAINELDADIGDKTQLPTVDKTNVVNAIKEIAKYPSCRVYNNSNISIPNAVYTVLPFNNEHFDTDNIHDNTTNNTRLTCKTAGVYLIIGSVSFGVNSTGVRTSRITLNNTDFLATVTNNATTIAIATRQSISAIYKLNVNDYVELFVYQDSGNSLDIVNESKTSPILGMVKVG